MQPLFVDDVLPSHHRVEFTESMSGLVSRIDSDERSGPPGTLALDEVVMAVHPYRLGEGGGMPGIVLSGRVRFPAVSEADCPVTGGILEMFPTTPHAPSMRCDIHFEAPHGARFRLIGTKGLRPAPGRRAEEVWRRATTLHVVVHSGDPETSQALFRGELSIGPAGVGKLLASLRSRLAQGRPAAVGPLAAQMATMTRFLSRYAAGSAAASRSRR